MSDEDKPRAVDLWTRIEDAEERQMFAEWFCRAYHPLVCQVM
jgi:hypothetical protein